MTSRRQPALGVHLLETITRGMYSEPLHSLREYVQNAYDGIRSARRDGLLGPTEGEIRFYIDPDSKTIRIRDDGVGLGPEEAAVHLVDLGSSEKAVSDVESAKNAGFRGIGRMAGITYCEELRFITSNGDGRKCTVEFDAEGINRLTRAGQKATTIIDAIRDNTDIIEEEEDRGQHYLEVEIKGINRAGTPFLDEDRVIAYLSQVAPVAYDPEWSFGDKILEFSQNAANPSSLDSVRITMRNPDGGRRFDVRRSLRNTFETGGTKRRGRVVKVKDVVALPRNSGDVEGWWGWLAIHEREGYLADVPFAGLRVRMHNIEIGDAAILRDLFVTPSHATWCFGEIHITDYRCTPNARRDNFEKSDAWNRIRESLREQARLIARDIRGESGRRSKSVDKIRRQAKAIQRKAEKAIDHGFVSQEEKKALVKELTEETERISRLEGKRKKPEGDNRRIKTIQDDLRNAKARVNEITVTEADIVNAHFDRATRRVLRKVREVLQLEVDAEKFREIMTKIHDALRSGKRS